jgi:hypothetical protein
MTRIPVIPFLLNKIDEDIKIKFDCNLESLCSWTGCAMSGLIADSRTLIDKARVEAQNHWFTYNEKMSVQSVALAVSNLALQFGDDDADPGAMVSFS